MIVSAPRWPKGTTTPPSEEAVQLLQFNPPDHKAGSIELVRISDLRARDSRIHKPTRLGFHIVHFVLEDQGKHWVNFEPVKLRRGRILHIQSSQVHSFDADSRHEALLLLFLPEVVQSPELLATLNFHMAGSIHPEPADFQLLLDPLRLFESPQSDRTSINTARLEPYYLSAIISAISEILTNKDSQQRRSTSKGSEQLVYRFETLLQSSHAEHRDLDWYVSRLNVTGRTLARACHSIRGQSPKKLIDARITLEAKRQLILSAETVEEIAFSLGFSESTNFVKFFKRVAGQTPEGFRKSKDI